MKILIAVAAGGALGAVARHVLADQVTRLAGDGWPWGIFVVNVLGCVLLGILIQASTSFAEPMPALRAFLAIGVLGAFTTFSAFSLDTVMLIERGQFLPAAAYIVASVLFSVGGLFAGMSAVRLATG